MSILQALPPPAHRHATPLVHDFFEHSAARLADKVALTCKGVSFTYGDLNTRADALANALVAAGVDRGDRVVIFADNSVETVVSFWATLKANAVVSVVNPLTKQEKLTYYLNDSRAKVLITDMNFAAAFNQSAPACTHLTTTVVAGKFDAARMPAVKNAVSFDAVVEQHLGKPAPLRRCIDVDLAAIIYTSGSSGDPKGVMLSHHNMVTAAHSITTLLEMNESDVVLAVLPLAFNYGLYQLIMTFRVGGRLVLERSFAYPAQVLKLMQDERVTGFPGVPTIYAVLAEMKNLRDFDLSAVRFVTNTAAALPIKHIAMLRGLLPNARIYSMYGLTECKRCTYLPPEDLDRKPTSVGIAIPNTEMWLVDEHDQKLGANVVGQLVIRGSTVMQGYWDKPEATAERLRPGLLPFERVFYTGDLCRLDDEGYLYFVARMDDIIKSRGEKVSPKEVETALMNITGVREAAVIGVPDELLGQAIKAFVVLEADVALTDKDIMKECQKRLESFMVPRVVQFIAELPKTATGKIMKTGLA